MELDTAPFFFTTLLPKAFRSSLKLLRQYLSDFSNTALPKKGPTYKKWT
jgi:hypothetical protein